VICLGSLAKRKENVYRHGFEDFVIPSAWRKGSLGLIANLHSKAGGVLFAA